MEIFLSQDRDFFRPRALTKILTKSTKFGENHEKSDILGPKPRKKYEKKRFSILFLFFRNLWVFLVLENRTAASDRIWLRVCPALPLKNSL